MVGERERAAGVYIEQFGKPGKIIIAGDLFHTRGQMDPEVFNPVHDRICKLLGDGFRFVAIPGNHDLKSKETTELGNAMQSLGKLPNFNVVTNPVYDISTAY